MASRIRIRTNGVNASVEMPDGKGGWLPVPGVLSVVISVLPCEVPKVVLSVRGDVEIEGELIPGTPKCSA